MEDRYPFIRFVIDAAQFIAGAVALIIVLGGTASACSQGGFGGFIWFLITLAVAVGAYVLVMACIDLLRVLLDIESSTRDLLAAQREAPPAGGTETST
jgi:hypothetical protein